MDRKMRAKVNNQRARNERDSRPRSSSERCSSCGELESEHVTLLTSQEVAEEMNTSGIACSISSIPERSEMH
jgi:hypothetical protein